MSFDFAVAFDLGWFFLIFEQDGLFEEISVGSSGDFCFSILNTNYYMLKFQAFTQREEMLK